MKKITNPFLLGLIVLLGSSFETITKNTLKIATAVFVIKNYESRAQFLPSNNPDGSYTLFKPNSPTSVYGNRWDILKLTNDSFIVRSKILCFDSLAIKNNSITSNSKIAWINPTTKELSATSFSLISFPSSNTLTSISGGTGISITNGSVIANTSPDQVVSLTAGNNDITITGTYPNFVITPYTPTTYTVSRTINSATFQPSATRRLRSAIYNVGISCTASIGSNASGIVKLQYSLDNGSTWIDAPEIKNSNTVTLAVALQSVNDQEAIIAINDLPVGVRLKLIPTTVGTTTITYIRGYETY